MLRVDSCWLYALDFGATIARKQSLNLEYVWMKSLCVLRVACCDDLLPEPCLWSNSFKEKRQVLSFYFSCVACEFRC